MKSITLLLLIISFNLLFSQNNDEIIKAKKAFSRYIEYAHPSPIIKSTKNELPEFLLDESEKRFEDKSMTVNEEVFAQKMQNESSIAVNPTNPLNLIASAVDYRDNSSTWVYVSHDGGKSWINHNLGKPFTYWRSTNDPSVAFTADGVAYLNYGGFQTQPNPKGEENGENAVFIARSYDEGNTWEAHIPVIIHLGLQTLDSTFEDKYYIEIDNSKESPYFGSIYIPWKQVTARDSATQIVISKSLDGGTNWTSPLGISHRLPGSSEDTTFGQSFPLATTGPNGNVYVCWNHGIEHGIGFVKSIDGGESYTEPRIIHNYNIFGETKFLSGQGYRHTVKGGVRAEAYPVMRCDNSESEGRGNLYLAWAADNPPNVYFSKSEDEGETWSEPVIVHSETKNDQFWAWLDIDPLNGDIAIMYLDSRDDPDNILVDCYVSYSSNQGDTWIDRKASSMQSDLRLNPFSGNSFAGDYSGIAFYNGMIYPSWVDMRDAVNNISDSDVFTSIINVNAPNPVENFAAEVVPDNPRVLKLSWKTPQETTFGRIYNPVALELKLFRDDEMIAEFNGLTESYEDTDLSPYTEYNYSIIAVDGKNESIESRLTATSGGAIEPAQPEITEINTEYIEENEIALKIKMPETRADNNTILVGLNKIQLYLFYRGELMKSREYELDPDDIGEIFDFTEFLTEPEIPVRGYYTLSAKVFSEVDDINSESKPFEQIIFIGKKESDLSDDFDAENMNLYLVQGNWALTDEFSLSGQNSLTESPYTDYTNTRIDTITFFPVYLSQGQNLGLNFFHAALANFSEKLVIEYTYDNENWNELISLKNLGFAAWKDGVRNEDDWKPENFIIYGSDAEIETRVAVRMRFVSDNFSNGDGWYIDDLNMQTIPASVDDNLSKEAFLYPNPASDKINIIANNSIPENIEIYDIYGNKALNTLINYDNNNAEISINNLPSGTYFARFIINGRLIQQKFLKIN